MRSVQQLDLSGLQILDGGLATELERRGFDLSGPLWSAQVLESSPAAIAGVHRDYLDAGADCLTTASYQVSAEGYRALGYNTERAAEAAARALHASVEIAIQVRRDYQSSVRKSGGVPRKIWVAASLGPYGAALANGAEYHGHYDCSFAALVDFHGRRLEVLASSEADFVAFETVPSQEEARAIAAALHLFPDLPASLSFTCRDGSHVAHGERLGECAAWLAKEHQLVALGVNCTSPQFAAALIRELRNGMTGSHASAKAIAVYPNSGEGWDAARRGWTRESARFCQPRGFAELARDWQAAGAQWFGGCCRTGPEHIRALSEMLSPPLGLPDHATMDSPQ